MNLDQFMVYIIIKPKNDNFQARFKGQITK